MQTEHQWLPHLENSIPDDVFGYTLSMYSIALEGWRRGLTLRFRNRNRSKAQTVFYLSNGTKEHRFEVSRGDAVLRKAIRICVNKELTKKYLQKANVPTPKGKSFKDESVKDIISYANKLGYPLVIKPIDGTGGHGVIANIKNELEFKQALTYVRGDLKYKEIIVERHFEGIDCRVYVINNDVIGAIKRVPASIKGDGKSTIESLIKQKNEDRFKNPALYGRSIKIDRELHNMLSESGYTLNSIPKKDEIVLLKSKNNVSAGGESIDITDELSDEIKQVAIEAVKAIPGLLQGGVDLMVNLSENKAEVIEINSRPHITAQLFPAKGKARNIPKAIIDYYFPDTEANYNSPLFYFDFKHIWNTFRKGITKEITIPNVPTGIIVSKAFIVSGDIQQVNYGEWIKKHALKLNLNGNIEHLDNGNAKIIVAGEEDSVQTFINLIKNQSPTHAKVRKIIEDTLDSSIKIGFEVINPEKDRYMPNGYYPVRMEGLRETLIISKKAKKIEKTNKKNESNKTRTEDYYKKEYEKIINSTSWKITKPLRLIGRLFK